MKAYKIIEKYNNWIAMQRKVFLNNKINCPYFVVTQRMIKNLNKEHQLLLNKFESDGYINNIEFKIWSEIFSKIAYIPKIKKSKPKELKDISLENKVSIKKTLLDCDFFVMHLKNQGFNPIKYHFKWMVENKIIKPCHSTKTEVFFNYYQLLEYETIDKYKEKSLEYPNPKILELEKRYIIRSQAITWQDYLLLNKKIIENHNKKYKQLIDLLNTLNFLDKQIFNKLLAIKKKDKENKLNKVNVKHIHADLRYKTYKYYSDRIIKKTNISQALLEYWIYSLLPAKVITYNPLWQITNKLPAIDKILKEEEKIGSSIFNKKNNIKIANFYVDIMKKLSEFLRASFNQNLINISEMLSRENFNKNLVCPICKEFFITNKERRGGKKQVLCGNPSCEKEWRRIRAKKNRAKSNK
jgi:hypothetical protein